MHHIHIPDFLNHLSGVSWKAYLPTFKDKKGDDATLHLIRFHMHICKFKVKFHEDCLMNMFMVSLEGNAQLWYESLPSNCLYSLRNFHIVFYERYKEHHPSLLLVKDCFTHVDNFIKDLESFYEDDQFMDDEIIKAIHERPLNHEEDEEIGCYDTQENFQKELISPIIENETNLHFNDLLSHELVDDISQHFYIS